jgi:3-mercaptopyruvate sulfurtransferase SseA
VKTLLLRPIFFVLLAIALVLVACGGPATTTTGIPGPPSPQELEAQGFVHPELPRITCEQLKKMMDDGEPLVVVDTRQQFFFNMGHIPQSINILYEPFNESPEGLLTLPKDRLIIFYCD